MKSYLGDAALKDRFLVELRWHQDQDRIIKGTYGINGLYEFQGCAVGCSINSLMRINPDRRLHHAEHALYETHLGIPEWLAHLEDAFFEGMPLDYAKRWPVRFGEAIPVGVDLNPVATTLLAYLVDRVAHQVLPLEALSADVRIELRTALTMAASLLDTPRDDEARRIYAGQVRTAGRRAVELAWDLPGDPNYAAEAADSAGHFIRALVDYPLRWSFITGAVEHAIEATVESGMAVHHPDGDADEMRSLREVATLEYAEALLIMLTEAGAS